jgi:RNA polymerase sigma-70 factor, ECF subfamily
MGDRGQGRAARFIAGLEPPRALDPQEMAALERELGAALEAARVAWPDVEIEEASFLRYFAERVRPDEEPVARVVSAHAGDLYLACGCALGLVGAIERFNRELMEPAVRDLERSGILRDIAEETVLDSQVDLLLGDERPPGIGDYRGIGRLRAWLRTRHLREAIRRRNRRERERSLHEGAGDEQAQGLDPLVRAYDRGAYGPKLRESLSAALERLSPRQRNLLRQRYVYRFGLERLASLYDVHHSTVARWLKGAEEQIARHTRSDLRERCGLSASECDSLLRLLQSQLELSVRGVLGTDLERDG